MMNLGMFVWFMFRRTWHKALCAALVSGIFVILLFKSWVVAIAYALVTGLLVAIISATTLWKRGEVPWDEIVDSHGDFKPCPRCKGALFETSTRINGELTCSVCGVGYYAPKSACLTHESYSVILSK